MVTILWARKESIHRKHGWSGSGILFSSLPLHVFDGVSSVPACASSVYVVLEWTFASADVRSSPSAIGSQWKYNWMLEWEVIVFNKSRKYMDSILLPTRQVHGVCGFLCVCFHVFICILSTTLQLSCRLYVILAVMGNRSAVTITPSRCTLIFFAVPHEPFCFWGLEMCSFPLNRYFVRLTLSET